MPQSGVETTGLPPYPVGEAFRLPPTNTLHSHPHNRVILREQTPLWGVCESNFKKQATNCLLF